MSLAVKYRPRTFEEVSSQTSIIKILRRQLELKQFSNCYLFCGPSGVGKTTLARIFATNINQGNGEPIEIDGASNNGVDNVKTIINSARERALDAEYKIYIIDECHAITSQGWQAFLKCIEEPPQYTIFMFCTTNAEKVPPTIQNRVMKFNLTKVKTKEIENRLNYICEQEHFTNYVESCDFISKLANGGCRDAIAMLEKCANYNTDLSINNVLTCLGNFSYKTLFELTNALLDDKEDVVLTIIDSFYDAGNDLRLFIDQYLDFILDLDKYCIFKSMTLTKIPASMENDVKYATAIENNVHYYNWLVDKLLNVKNIVKNDSSVKTTMEVLFIDICKGYLA